MAELAVGIVGLAGLIAVAEASFSRVHKFIKDVQRAENQVNDLFLVISSLCGTLRGVEEVVKDMTFAEDDRQRYNAHISHGTDLLQLISQRLNKFRDQGRNHSAILPWGVPPATRVRWPFSRGETQRMLKEVEQHQNALCFALLREGLSLGLSANTRLRNVEDGLAKVHDFMSLSIRNSLKEHQRQFLTTLCPLEPFEQHRFNTDVRQADTGIWFLESLEFKDWNRTSNSKLWIYGIAGAGKSILASAAFNAVIKHIGSSSTIPLIYFCDFKKPETHLPEALWASLIVQIAQRSEKTFALLGDYARQQSGSEHQDAATQFFDSVHQWSRNVYALQAIFKSMLSDLVQVVVFVDGLDEAGAHLGAMIRAVHELSRSSPKVRCFLSSRDVPEIRQAFGKWPSMPIAARNTDLKAYVGSQIQSRIETGWPKPLELDSEDTKAEIMDALIEGAQGMFRWVSLQLDHICDLIGDEAIREQLRNLPAGIDESYERLLQAFNKKPASTQLIISRALKWIVGHGRIPPGVIGEALGIDPLTSLSPAISSWINDDRVLRLCSSFIRRNNNNLEPAHFTVKEFLSSATVKGNPQYCQYAVDEDTDRKIFAIAAVSHLLREDVQMSCINSRAIRVRHERHPFRAFIMFHWPFWLDAMVSDSGVMTLAQKLFESPVPNGFQSWALECVAIIRDNRLLQSSPEAASGDPGDDPDLAHVRDTIESIPPLHCACAVGSPELCRALLSLGVDPNIRARCGSALYCALLGRTVFDAKAFTNLADGTPFKTDITSVEIVRALISRSVDFNQRPLPHDVYPSPLGLTALTSLKQHEVRPFQDLVAAGAAVDDEVRRYLIATFHSPKRRGRVLSMLTALDSSGLAEPDKIAVEGIQDFLSAPGTGITQVPNKYCLENESDQYLASTLATAIDTNNAEAVERIFAHSKYLSARGHCENGDGPLHRAAKAGPSTIAELLLKHGADVDQIDAQHRTALHVSLASAHARVARSLLKYGANWHLKDAEGSTVWHYAAGLSVGSRRIESRCRIDCLEELHRIGQASLAMDEEDRRGRTPMMIAARCGHLEVVKKLLEYGADEWHRDMQDRSILHMAAGGGSNGLVQFLLQRHHDLDHMDITGRSALFYATESKILSDTLLITILAQSQHHMWSKDENGKIPMDLLLNNTHADRLSNILSAVETLTAHADAPLASNLLRYLVPWIIEHQLHEAERPGGYISRKTVASLSSIWQKVGAVLFPPEYGEELAQHIVTLLRGSNVTKLDQPGGNRKRSGHENQVDFGLDLHDQQPKAEHIRADIIEALSVLISKISRGTLRSIRVRQQPVLTRLIYMNCEPLCHAVLDRVVDIKSRSKKRLPETALQAVCRVRTPESVLNRIFDYAAPLTDAPLTTSQQSLLHLASMSGNLPTVERLLDSGLDPSARDARGRTPLHYASWYEGHMATAVVKIMLAKGAKPSLSDGLGMTPSHVASFQGNVELLRLFAADKHGWKVTCSMRIGGQMVGGLTPLHIAGLRDHLECFEYLLGLNEFDLEQMAGAQTMSLACLADSPSVVEMLSGLRKDWVELEDGSQSLIHAVRAQNHRIIQVLLGLGYSPRFHDKSGHSALSIARKDNNSHILDLLGQARAVRDRDDALPFLVESAIKDGNWRKLKALINRQPLTEHLSAPYGCDALIFPLLCGKSKLALALAKLGFRSNGLMCPSSVNGVEGTLQLCARLDYPDVLAAILEKNPWLLFVEYDIPIIHLAIWNYSHKCLEYILEKAAAIADSASASRPCIHTSCPHDHNSCGKRSGASASGNTIDSATAFRQHRLLDSKDLRYVCLHARKVLPKSVAPGVDVTSMSLAAMLPLHSAVESGNFGAARALLAWGVDVDRVTEWSSATALSLALYRRNYQMVDLLMSAGASLSACDDSGMSCHQIWAVFGDCNSIHYRTAEAQITPSPPTDSQGRSPVLSFATVRGSAVGYGRHLTNIKGLLDVKGASSRPWHISMWQYLLHSDLDLSECSDSFGSVMNTYWSNSEFWADGGFHLLKRLCRRLSPDQAVRLINFRPLSGFTTLYAAALSNACEGIGILLDNGADVDVPGGPCGTPVMAACVYGRLEALRILVHAGASLHYTEVNRDGEAVCHSAFGKATLFPKIQRWLLVERWTEQRKLGFENTKA